MPSTKVPAYLCAFFLAISLSFSIWRDIVDRATNLPTPNGIATPNSMRYDGVYFLGWASPLFLAVAVSFYATTLRNRPMVPAFSAKYSPHQIVNVIIGIVIFSNILTFALALVAKFSFPSTHSKKGGHESHNSISPSLLVFNTVARQAARPSFYNMAWSLITAIRHPQLSPIQSAFGITYEHSIAIHCALGWLTIFWLNFHTCAYMLSYTIQSNLFAKFTPDNFSGLINLTGLIAIICLSTMTAAAIPKVRESRYTVFALLHWLYIPFFFFAISHYVHFFLILLPPLFLYVIDRLAFLNGNLNGPTGAKRVAATLVRISDKAFALLVPVGTAESAPSQDLDQIYVPGRFVSLALANDPACLIASHPFSIAAYSAENQTFSVIVRVLGPWTTRVHSLSTKKGSFIQMWVSGPFSTPALALPQNNVESHQILIAGGVGISKLLSRPGDADLDDGDDIETKHEEPSVRKMWLCKDPKELVMYACLGAKLNGWDWTCKELFNSSSLVIPKSIALSSQSIQLPLPQNLRLILGTVYMFVYIGLYMASRYTLTYDPDTCANVGQINSWIVCSRGYGYLPFSYILLGTPLVTMSIGLLLNRQYSVKRPKSKFICHTLASAQVGHHVKTFDLANDIEWSNSTASEDVREDSSKPLILRSCTGKPVRDSIRLLARHNGAMHMDDGLGF